MLRHSRVVVTGVGMVTPLAANARATWQRIMSGGSGVRRLDALKGLPTELAAPTTVTESPTSRAAADRRRGAGPAAGLQPPFLPACENGEGMQKKPHARRLASLAPGNKGGTKAAAVCAAADMSAAATLRMAAESPSLRRPSIPPRFPQLEPRESFALFFFPPPFYIGPTRQTIRDFDCASDWPHRVW